MMCPESDDESFEKEFAYFRVLDASKQCELRFHLKEDIENFGIIDTEIKAVRQATDNVGSMIEHIKNKIIHIIETRNKENELNDNNNVAIHKINPKFTSTNTIKGKTVCRNLVNLGAHLEFHIFQQTFKVIINAPLIQQINLPVVIYANHTIQPTKLKALYLDKTLSEYFWYKSLDKTNWIQIGDKYNYKPTVDDVGHYLKFSCIPKNKRNGSDDIFEVISESTVQVIANIPKCPFEERHKLTVNKLKGKLFRVISYNTLSDRYNETNAQFPYCPPEALAIDYRKQLILKELLGYNADIMCLQEIDFKVHVHYFKKEFKNHGYDSIFYKKGNRLTEGLACVYNKERFTLLDSTQLVLSEHLSNNALYSHIWAIVKQNNDLKVTFKRQATSLQITILKMKQTNAIVVVANTHLYYHKEANHVRLIQVAMIISYINNIKKKLTKPNKNKICVVFCGDLNSLPTSAVYYLLTNGDVPYNMEEYQKITYKESNFLQHPFKFKSACGTPEYTNYTSEFKGCLDYIFYDTSTLAIDRVIPLPTVDVLAQNTALPSVVFPSDHVALIADLKVS